MQYAQRIVLIAPPWDSPKLETFVEKCIRDKVVLVCVMGDDCERVSDVIDEMVVGDGSDPSRFILRSWHPDKSLDEVLEFANSMTVDIDPSTPVQVVRL